MSDILIVGTVGKSHAADLYGLKQLSGTTYEVSTEHSYTVHLHFKPSGRFVLRTVSADDGSYTFTHLADADYYAVGLDFASPSDTPAISEALTLTDMVIPDF